MGRDDAAGATPRLDLDCQKAFAGVEDEIDLAACVCAEEMKETAAPAPTTTSGAT